MFDLSAMTKDEIKHQLYEEMSFYSEDLDELAKLFVKEIPKKYTMRIISKMYRLRMNQIFVR